jgi:hypothetical protein
MKGIYSMAGNTNPLTFKDGNLQPGQALGNLPLNVALTADNQTINPGVTPFIRIVSDNTTAANRTFTLFKGAYQGQQICLTLVPTSAGVATGRAQLASSGNTVLTGGTWEPAVNDSLMLQWDGITSVWREIGRAVAAQQLVSGTYTPTFTAGTNVGTATAGVAHYIRVGTQVSVWGTGSIASTTATNTASIFTISLPIASDLAAAGDLTGSGNILSATSVASAGVTITAGTTDNNASCAYNAAQTAAGTLGYSFSYTVL